MVAAIFCAGVAGAAGVCAAAAAARPMVKVAVANIFTSCTVEFLLVLKVAVQHTALLKLPVLSCRFGSWAIVFFNFSPFSKI
jgi:hypothetical protein